MRSLWAFIVAAFPAALVQSIVVAMWPKEGMGVFQNPPSMFVAVCIYFYLFGLLIGLPAWLILRRRIAGSLRVLATAGLLVGLLPVGAALFWTASRGGSSAYVVIYNLLFFGLGGLAAGWTYWRVAGRGRAAMALEQAEA